MAVFGCIVEFVAHIRLMYLGLVEVARINLAVVQKALFGLLFILS